MGGARLELAKVVNATQGPAWDWSRWVTGLPGFPVVVLQLQDGGKVSVQTRNAVKIQDEIDRLIEAGGTDATSLSSAVNDTN